MCRLSVWLHQFRLNIHTQTQMDETAEIAIVFGAAAFLGETRC